MAALMEAADAAIIGWMTDGILSDHSSRVTAEWPLAKLQDALAVAVGYLLFIFVFAKMMQAMYGKEEPVAPKNMTVSQKFAREPILILQAVYNPIQVALCGWMVFEALRQKHLRGMSIVCNAFEPAQTGMARVLWVFYLSKVLDFMDTFFMIARRKWRQLSFLHIYHHTSIFLIYWMNLNAAYDGDIYFTIVLNGAIHFVMYGYYALQTFNIAVPLAVKAMITKSQMVQFVCMNLQALCLLYGDCAFPRKITWFYMFYIFSMLFLFNDFSRKTYTKGAKRSLAESKNKTKSDDAAVVAGKAAEERSDTTEVLINGVLYDVRGMKHPGGSIIRFLTGVGDATHAFAEFHERSKKADRYLKALPNRPCPPEILAVRQSSKKDQELTKDFSDLRAKLKAEGFFNPAPLQIAWRYIELIIIHAVGAWLVRSGIESNASLSSMMAGVVGIIVLGLGTGRCGWLMHEGGHYSLTGVIGVDRMLQAFTYGAGCAMSGRWWRIQHNKHHATPQKLKHDADLDTLPLVSFNAKVSDRVRSPLLKSWLRLQATLFVPISCALVALGWILFLHPRHIYRCLSVPSSRNEAFAEAISILLRFYLILSILCEGLCWSARIGVFVSITSVGAMYIFTNFALSHTHLPTTNPDECVHWVKYASAHTTNLQPGVVCNWWMCYLNYQIEHHLFPSMPQFRHPIVAEHVKVLFEKHGLQYDVRPYWKCMGETLNNLHIVGQSAGSQGGGKKTD